MSFHCARPKRQRHLQRAALQAIDPKQNITPAIADCRYREPLSPRLARKSYDKIKRMLLASSSASFTETTQILLYRFLYALSRLFFLRFFLPAQFPKKILHHLTALLLQYSNNLVHLMIEAFFLQQVQNASGAPGFRIHSTDHNFGNPGLHDRTGAHRTRF